METATVSIELDTGSIGTRFRLSDESDERNGGWSSLFRTRKKAVEAAYDYMRRARQDLRPENVKVRA